jgi:hypothetical protein
VSRGAGDAVAALFQNVDVLHGGAQLLVAREPLNGPDIGAVLQQVRRKGVSKGMAGGPLLDVGRVGGLLDGPLHGRVGAVVAADGPAAWVLRECRGGKHVLPAPLRRRVWVLFRQGVGQVDAAYAFGTVRLVLGLHCFQVAPEQAVEALGQHHRPVRSAFAVPDVEAAGSNVEFFDPEAKGFGQSESASIESPLP